MTDRAEIERLLNATGRTLEGLPTLNDYRKRDLKTTCEAMQASGIYETFPFIMHQSDVIKLLVGALRDALEKPMQKPLTLGEATKARTFFVEYRYVDELRTGFVLTGLSGKEYSVVAVKNTNSIYTCVLTEMSVRLFGKMWRCWASKPTDEEREAAAWES